MNSSRCFGSTTAIMRSCDSDMRYLLRLAGSRRAAGRGESSTCNAAVTVGGELAGGTGEPGTAEVLDAVDDAGRVEIETGTR